MQEYGDEHLLAGKGGEVLGERDGHDVESRGDEDHEAAKEEDGGVVGEPSGKAPLLYVPDGVEGGLDAVHQVVEGIEHHDGTDADDVVALGIGKVVVNEAYDVLADGGLRLECVVDPPLEGIVNAKASCNDVHEGKEGDEGHEGGVGERGYVAPPYLLMLEDAPCEHEGLQPREEEGLDAPLLLCGVEPPYLLCEEEPDLEDLASYHYLT